MAGSSPGTWAIPRCICRELDWKQSSRVSNLCSDMGYQCCSQWLNPLCHNSNPNSTVLYKHKVMYFQSHDSNQDTQLNKISLKMFTNIQTHSQHNLVTKDSNKVYSTYNRIYRCLQQFVEQFGLI